jgi:hypothetical protein
MGHAIIFHRSCAHNHSTTNILTVALSCTSIMPPKRKFATPLRKRTPKKSQKAGAFYDVHYLSGGLQTSFAVEGMSLLIAQYRC